MRAPGPFIQHKIHCALRDRVCAFCSGQATGKNCEERMKPIPDLAARKEQTFYLAIPAYKAGIAR